MFTTAVKGKLVETKSPTHCDTPSWDAVVGGMAGAYALVVDAPWWRIEQTLHDGDSDGCDIYPVSG